MPMEIPDLRPRILQHDDLLRALGRMTVRFQELEHYIRWVAASQLDPKDREVGEIATQLLNISGLIDTTRALYLYRHPDMESEPYEQFEKIFTEARSINDQRNTFIHSVWPNLPNSSGTFTRSKRSKKSFKSTTENVTVEQIEALNDRLQILSGAMIAYVDDEIIQGVIGALREEDGKQPEA